MSDCGRLSEERVLVTGASGFIGSTMCGHLSKRVGEVHAISRRFVASTENSVRFWQGDLADISTARKLLERIKPDLIFHMAGHVAGARDLELILPTFHSNLATTVNVLTAATEVGCRRIVLPGSLEEPEGDGVGVVPSSPYAASKWAASEYARMFYSLYGLPIVIARVFMTYGPGRQHLRKLIPYVITSLLQDKVPKLASGEREIDWIYIDDVIEGLVALAQVPKMEGTTIDLGSGKLVSIRSLAELIATLTGSRAKPVFAAVADRPFEQVRVADTARSREIIGWEPKISLEEGLRRTVDWYKRRLQEGNA